MGSIEFLRQFRFGGYAIFDLTVSFLGMYLLSPLLSKIFKKINIEVPKINWVFLTLPIGIITHLLIGRITPMVKDLFDINGHRVLKVLILCMSFYGMRDIRMVSKKGLKRQLKSAQEYTNFVREFVTLLDQQLCYWEIMAKNKERHYEVAHQMPALISLVNTVGYLRGQDGMFLDIRPKTDNQKEFYGYEDAFEKRLENLIDIIMDSDQKQHYLERLDSYLVKSRTKQTPTV